MPRTLTNRLLVNYTEAAALLSVGRTTVFRLVKAGDLTAVKIGSSSRITMDSVLALAGSMSAAANMAVN